MKFTKMHGAGNDYVYVNSWEERLPADLPALAREISDRHMGVGSDGLIVVGPSELADARMRIWNADGSEAEMCGNGLRCVARFVYDRGIARRPSLRIETGRGIVTAQVELSGGRVRSIRTGLGVPILRGADIPTTLPGDPPRNVRLELAGGPVTVTAVSMGNPHCVLFLDRSNPLVLDDATVSRLGREIERHPAFPRRTNVEFIQMDSTSELRMRVWERGAGETRACGSGACAAVVAAVLTGRSSRSVRCRLPGGTLDVEWSDAGEVYLTGPAEEVFVGDYPLRRAMAESKDAA